MGLEGEGLLGRRVDEAQSLQREKGGRAPGGRGSGCRTWRGGRGLSTSQNPEVYTLPFSALCLLPALFHLSSSVLLGRQAKLQS